MKKWEYLYINRWREPESKTGWKNTILTATGEQGFPFNDMAQALASLGDQGWELVSAVPLSSHPDAPGFSDGMVLYFKRTKSG